MFATVDINVNGRAYVSSRAVVHNERNVVVTVKRCRQKNAKKTKQGINSQSDTQKRGRPDDDISAGADKKTYALN